MRAQKFTEEISNAYQFEGESFPLGCGILDGKPIGECRVNIPLATLNRHGLVAGATGTGKTKTIQVLAEGLSDHQVPVLLMDLKGDLSGLAASGSRHPKIEERQQHIGIPFVPKSFPVELMSLSNDYGIPLRATITEFGPILLSKVLDLNETQSGVLAVLFKYLDDEAIPLVDLKDLKKALRFIMEDGKQEFESSYGRVSSASVGAIQRKIIALEQQGAEQFFGEPSFEIDDLMRLDQNQKAFISIMRLTDIQDRPALFSSFMLSLLVELYESLPEQGDADRPKLVIFIDEAHLLFREASDALVDQLEIIVKLIRSKGVGLFFCTQAPDDIPNPILGQLGLRVQHALRAVTAKDRKAIKLVAENFPLSDFYKTEEALTSLGIGEALFTCLNEKGIPTPLVATYLLAPRSRMGVLSDPELAKQLSRSELMPKYQKAIDRDSAFEMLNRRMVEEEDVPKPNSPKAQRNPASDSLLESLSKNTFVRQMGRTVIRELSRGLMGVLGLKGRR
ncbi:helicase HerA-like domain-containing protein [Persicobacter diffluens]|uniref:ATPase n=1 Tax=Persicobacter diffluens TaxID=981 RepID=A0AAN5APF4_9BACT|nr:ATPase [Persicobacter diffluens]